MPILRDLPATFRLALLYRDFLLFFSLSAPMFVYICLYLSARSQGLPLRQYMCCLPSARFICTAIYVIIILYPKIPGTQPSTAEFPPSRPTHLQLFFSYLSNNTDPCSTHYLLSPIIALRYKDYNYFILFLLWSPPASLYLFGKYYSKSSITSELVLKK